MCIRDRYRCVSSGIVLTRLSLSATDPDLKVSPQTREFSPGNLQIPGHTSRTINKLAHRQDTNVLYVEIVIIPKEKD